MTVYTRLDTPIGQLLLVGDKDGLREIRFETDRKGHAPEPGWQRDPEAFREECSQLEAYFAGERTKFKLRLAPKGTPFQLRVWNELAEIPYGETISYGELARRVSGCRKSPSACCRAPVAPNDSRASWARRPPSR